jgi:hypothetical protein
MSEPNKHVDESVRMIVSAEVQQNEELVRHHIVTAIQKVLRDVRNETGKWTKRCDDAKRIPDLIHDLMVDVR